MSVSFEEIGQVVVTCHMDGTVKAGNMVKISANDTVKACAADEKFCGQAASESRDGMVAVQIKGFIEADCADGMTAGLISKLRRYVKGPLICKPNAGFPEIREDGLAHYDMTPEDFSAVIKDCSDMGATLLGGCCGTTPSHIAAIAK